MFLPIFLSIIVYLIYFSLPNFHKALLIPLSLHMSFCLFVCLSVVQSVRLCPSVCLSVHLSACPYCRPDLVDMSLVSTQSNRSNLERAFGVAEQLGVARLLDPEGEPPFIHSYYIHHSPFLPPSTSASSSSHHYDSKTC